MLMKSFNQKTGIKIMAFMLFEKEKTSFRNLRKNISTFSKEETEEISPKAKKFAQKIRTEMHSRI